MEALKFIREDLVRIRDDMLGLVKDQQPSEVFWSVLSTLVHDAAVNVDGSRSSDQGKPTIGKSYHPNPSEGVVGSVDQLCYVSTDLAMAEVNKCLRAQGRPELRVTNVTLVAQLRQDGRLFDEDGRPMSPAGDGGATRQLRIDGQVRRAFITSRRWLLQAVQEPYRTAETAGSRVPVATEGMRPLV